MLMNDKAKTRIRLNGITSYAPDKGFNYAISTSWPTIALTIGSVALTLAYLKEEDRDEDIKRLDDAIDMY